MFVSRSMTRKVITISKDADILDAHEKMAEKRIRHLPVVDAGRLVGIISMGDLVRWIMRSQSEAIQHLQGYISGQYPG